jgi:hypothetical protein
MPVQKCLLENGKFFRGLFLYLDLLFAVYQVVYKDDIMSAREPT